MANGLDSANSFDMNRSQTSGDAFIKRRLDHPTVLIVEDEFIVAEHLRARLQELGFVVVGVTASGREAIECAKLNSPDLVLMDFQIRSDLNGPEAAVIIQGLTESPVPIVFLTAYSPSDYPVIRAVEPYLYLQKPFTDADLKRILEKANRLRRIAS